MSQERIGVPDYSLASHETMVELIASTTMWTGLVVRRALDTRNDPKRIKVGDEAMGALNVRGDLFHPELNDTISAALTT